MISALWGFSTVLLELNPIIIIIIRPHCDIAYVWFITAHTIVMTYTLTQIKYIIFYFLFLFLI